jgi:hypothetical protein
MAKRAIRTSDGIKLVDEETWKLAGSVATNGKTPSEPASSLTPGKPESLTANMTPDEINKTYEHYMTITEKQALAESRRDSVEVILFQRGEQLREAHEAATAEMVKVLREDFGGELATRGYSPHEIYVAIMVALERFRHDGHEPIRPENYDAMVKIIKGYAEALVADVPFFSAVVYEAGVKEAEFKRKTVQDLLEQIGEDPFSLGFGENTWRAVITRAYARYFDEHGKPSLEGISVIKEYIMEMIMDNATHTFPGESMYEQIDRACCRLSKFGVARDEMEGAVSLETLTEALATLDEAESNRERSMGPGHNESGEYNIGIDIQSAAQAFGTLGLPDGESYMKATKFISEVHWVAPF